MASKGGAAFLQDDDSVSGIYTTDGAGGDTDDDEEKVSKPPRSLFQPASSSTRSPQAASRLNASFLGPSHASLAAASGIMAATSGPDNAVGGEDVVRASVAEGLIHGISQRKRSSPTGAPTGDTIPENTDVEESASAPDSSNADTFSVQDSSVQDTNSVLTDNELLRANLEAEERRIMAIYSLDGVIEDYRENVKGFSGASFASYPESFAPESQGKTHKGGSSYASYPDSVSSVSGLVVTSRARAPAQPTAPRDLASAVSTQSSRHASLVMRLLEVGRSAISPKKADGGTTANNHTNNTTATAIHRTDSDQIANFYGNIFPEDDSTLNTTSRPTPSPASPAAAESIYRRAPPNMIVLGTDADDPKRKTVGPIPPEESFTVQRCTKTILENLLEDKTSRLMVFLALIIVIAVCVAIGSFVSYNKSKASVSAENALNTGYQQPGDGGTFGPAAFSLAPIAPSTTKRPRTTVVPIAVLTASPTANPTRLNKKSIPKTSQPTQPLKAPPLKFQPSAYPTKATPLPKGAPPTIQPVFFPAFQPSQYPTNMKSVKPTSRPSLLRTMLPTSANSAVTTTGGSSLSGSPSGPVTCLDASANVTFFVSVIWGYRNCSWLSGRPGNKKLLCQSKFQPYFLCPVTCNSTTAICHSNASSASIGNGSPVSTLSPSSGSSSRMVTMQPTEQPSSLTSYLTNIILSAAPPSTASSIQVSGSPQRQALQFLSGQDTGNMTDLQIRQQFALATFAHSSVVAVWLTSSNWLVANHECKWLGISCDNHHRVVSISLPGNNVKGKLPPELSMLRNLTNLDLSGNAIAGTLPSDYGGLSKLVTLNLQGNNITGTLPDTIGNMSSLEFMYLQDNYFNGTVPSSIANLVKLEQLILWNNNFVGALPNSICSFSNLTQIMSDCRELYCSCWTRCYYKCGGTTGIPCQ